MKILIWISKYVEFKIGNASFSDRKCDKDFQEIKHQYNNFLGSVSTLMLILVRRVKAEKKKLVWDGFLMICADRWKRIYELRNTDEEYS